MNRVFSLTPTFNVNEKATSRHDKVNTIYELQEGILSISYVDSGALL